MFDIPGNTTTTATFEGEIINNFYSGTYSGLFEDFGDVDYVRVNLTASRAVTFLAHFASYDESYLSLALYDAAGQQLAFSPGGGENRELVYTAEMSGTYFLRISGSDNDALGKLGGYSMSMTSLPGSLKALTREADTYTTAADESVRGSLGNDRLTVGSGGYAAFGEQGDDTIFGGSLNSFLSGGEGNDQIFGGSGNEYVFGDGGNDNLSGGNGNDGIYGGDGFDVLSGGSGNDRLHGGALADKLLGGADLDQLWGDAGNDYLDGGEGNDTLNGGVGIDTMSGGTGDDTFYVDNVADKIIEAGGSANGKDTVYSFVSLGLAADAAIETLVSSTPKTSTLAINFSGNNFAQNIGGNNGANVLQGLGGDDGLVGNGGSDRLFGGLGNDTLIGGAGNDLFFFDTRANGTTNHDTIADFANASGNNDTIYINHAVYTTLATGSLGGAFAANAAGVATQADDRIIYETDTGNLFYDVNGSVAGGSTLFATLTGHPALTVSDFVVY